MSNRQLYEYNRVILNNYHWWGTINEELPPYEEAIKSIKDNVKTIRTTTITHPFFLNLNSPLLLKDELNTFHLEYVVDNVRRSEDFGGDNHVYLYYSQINIVYSIMMEYNLSRILADNKVFFLIGENSFKNHYPYDFITNEDIDYGRMDPKPFRSEEIHRLIIDNPTSYYSGNTFMAGILDAHPNLLTIRGFGGSELCAIYEEIFSGRKIMEARKVLENTTCKWVVNAFREMFFWKSKGDQEAIIQGPNWDEFWRIFADKCNEKTPDAGTFYRVFYLAYNEAIWGIRNSRVAPAIRETTHCNSSSIVRNGQKERIRQTFLYRREICINRNPVIRLASELSTGIDCQSFLFRRITFPLTNWIEYKERCFGAKWVLEEELSDDVRLIRFEDLKLNSVKALKALCVFCDIPFDEIMWYTTKNGHRSFYNSPSLNREISDFDHTPATDYKKKFLSQYDIYRYELIYDKELEAEGYTCLEYDGKKYSYREILQMFEEPFLINKKRRELYGLDSEEQFKNTLLEYVSHKLLHPVDETDSGEKLYHVPFLDVNKEAELFDSIGGEITEEKEAYATLKKSYNRVLFENDSDSSRVYVKNYFDRVLDDIEQMKRRKKTIEHQIKSNFKKVFLYGAGADGQIVGQQLLPMLADKEVCFVDRNPKLWGNEIINGIICKPPEMMYGCGKDAVIVISSSTYCQMIKNNFKQDSMQTSERLKDVVIEDEYCIICSELYAKKALA